MEPVSVLNSLVGTIKIPSSSAKVHKEECIYSFDSPLTQTGLYVSLSSFLGFGRDFVEKYANKSGNKVFLHIYREKIPVSGLGDGPEKKITRLALGLDGGFDLSAPKKKFEIKETYEIVIVPEFITTPWPNDNLPDKIKQSVEGILQSPSATEAAQLEGLHGTWDGEARIISKHALSLKQLDNGKKIPPSGWKCEQCDLTQNLWLNLTDGSILCGRKFFDGSGGNNHALEHYKTAGHPLAVKLGTITKDGKGDVYSYDEDDMVEDPLLVQHLSHWGINIANMEKTDKSMIELELDINQKAGEWGILQESGSKLQPLFGPGHTGLVNLGNSCYMNSVLQVVFAIPDFVQRFFDGAQSIIDNCSDPTSDFNLQMSKLANGLLSGKYSQPPQDDSVSEQDGISPVMFKSIVGRGHPDFSTKEQQDAAEFFLHLINLLERNSRHFVNPADCFKFRVEERYECSKSKKVKYNYRTEYNLPLPIPVDQATNKAEVEAFEKQKTEAEKNGRKFEPENIVRSIIQFQSCLEAFASSETLQQYYSTAVNDKVPAVKTVRLATFPDFLLIQLKKFAVASDWIPYKLDVCVDMPAEIDLSCLRGTGMQPGEEHLPELLETPPQPNFDPHLMSQLKEMMNMPEEVCKKALYFTGNQGLEAAINWVMEHVSDPDFDSPFVPHGGEAPSKPTFQANEEALTMIMAMGFTTAQATKALEATGNNVERAADWIFSHMGELDSEDAAPAAGSTPAEEPFRDGSSRYRLVAFISHMGKSTSSGHYVCHVKRDGRWVIYNDTKVALSEHPPTDLGYLYIYERI